MRTGLQISLLLLALLLSGGICLAGVSEVAVSEPLNVFESSPLPTHDTQIDKLVFAKLKQLHVQPVTCSDAVFVRRVFLDLIGTLPTAQESREFIQDPDIKDKRSRLIDRLLERPEFADYWAMKWSDILRIKAEFPVNLWPEAAQAYHQWVRSSIAQNKPYDVFVREMLTASGSNFRNGPVNFYRAIQNRTPEGIAGTVALTFMGTRIEKWPANSVSGLAAFFSQVGYKPTREWKEEIVFFDPLKSLREAASSSTPAAASNATAAAVSNATPAVAPSAPPAAASKAIPAAVRPGMNSATALAGASPPQEAIFPDGTKVKLAPNKDPREVFADWFVSPKNHWFKRAIVNRVWYWLLGRGIVEEADDIRPDNPPSNPALLSYLEKELVAGHYDLKRLYRLILNSKTYQLSSMTRSASPEAEANFASYPLRRLDAEVLIDAINKVTGTTDRYTSPIPEPFTYIPEDMPAIGIGDGSITSPFLTLFGRSARSTGLANERNSKPVPAQWLHMLNSSHIQRKLEKGPGIKAIIDSGHKPAEIVEELYLTILSRFPTAEEGTTALSYGTNRAPRQPQSPAGKPFMRRNPQAAADLVKQRKDWIDIAWSLINSSEFQYRH